VEKEQQKMTIEALLFLSEEPVSTERMAVVLSITVQEAEELVRALQQELYDSKRGLQIFEAAGGYQMGTLPELAPHLEKAFSEEVSSYLSTAALEALAIIAYKQPVTRIEVESIRGVRCEHILENLTKRKLIKSLGRKEGPGRPLLYGTTDDFLKYFGLTDLSDLPQLDLEQETGQLEVQQNIQEDPKGDPREEQEVLEQGVEQDIKEDVEEETEGK